MQECNTLIFDNEGFTEDSKDSRDVESVGNENADIIDVTPEKNEIDLLEELDEDEEQAYKEFDEAKNDYPSQIDFDAEALALDKSFFRDFSEGKQQLEKMTYLQKNYDFLQAQHSHVMSCLHAEVDELKRKNLELNLKLTELIAQPQYQSMDRTPNHPAISKESTDPTDLEPTKTRCIKMISEIKQLKESLGFYKKENKKLANAVERFKQQTSCDGQETQFESKDSCQAIIKHLNEINEHNISKIVRLKDDLYDAMNDENLPLSALMKSQSLGVKESKEGCGGIMKKFTLPKICRLRKSNQIKKPLDAAESSSAVLLPPLRTQARTKYKFKADRPHFKP